MDILEEIKSRVTMRQVLEFYGIYPVRGSNIYRCFVHQDKKPSANIIKGSEVMHCFSCQWSGDIFSVVQHFEKCDFKQAMRILDNRYGFGLYGDLTHKEKLELARRLKERERQKELEQKWKEFEQRVLIKISEQIRFWEQVQEGCHITRGEYKTGEWELCDLFFHSLQRQDFLTWLYNAICGFDQSECEFDYTYGRDKTKLLLAIKNKEIEII